MHREEINGWLFRAKSFFQSETSRFRRSGRVPATACVSRRKHVSSGLENLESGPSEAARAGLRSEAVFHAWCVRRGKCRVHAEIRHFTKFARKLLVTGDTCAKARPKTFLQLDHFQAREKLHVIVDSAFLRNDHRLGPVDELRSQRGAFLPLPGTHTHDARRASAREAFPPSGEAPGVPPRAPLPTTRCFGAAQ